MYCTLLESSESAGKTYFTIDDISASVETKPLDTRDQGRARADREHRGQLHGSPSDESIGDTQSTRNDMNNREDLGNSEVYEF